MFSTRKGAKTAPLMVIDGNQKLFRAVCIVSKTKINGQLGDVNNYDLCIRNPIRGNQLMKPSKYCNEHKSGSAPAYATWVCDHAHKPS